ncbi:unnamed protein product [Heligmosomoides polygyrus]|uniref:Secreted protein n=1 Tax=Heligmosomoides polygyrus TaxID=6339 RepID=A0A3P8A7L5_HELPZ|nr:unnamed protein product [Heligmosomoides polygyrus]
MTQDIQSVVGVFLVSMKSTFVQPCMRTEGYHGEDKAVAAPRLMKALLSCLLWLAMVVCVAAQYGYYGNPYYGGYYGGYYPYYRPYNPVGGAIRGALTGAVLGGLAGG